MGRKKTFNTDRELNEMCRGLGGDFTSKGHVNGGSMTACEVGLSEGLVANIYSFTGEETTIEVTGDGGVLGDAPSGTELDEEVDVYIPNEFVYELQGDNSLMTLTTSEQHDLEF